MVTHSKWFWLAALASAWFADFLFWGKAPGISFPIWILVVLLVGFVLSWRTGSRPSLWTILLAVLTVGFAVAETFRVNAMVNFASLVMVAGGLVLITATFLNGNWTHFRMVDYLVEGVKVVWAGFSRPFQTFSQPPALPEGQPAPRSFWRKAAPILRGILIAIPVVAVFAALFSSADPVFSNWLQRIFNLEKLPEYILRLVLILILAFWLVGMFLHAILPAAKAERPDPAKPWMKPFLGSTESTILLGAVNLLFIAFVIIQVRYLFGGTANISETGFTYSEYARRGFSELVAVAALSLVLFLVLSTITRIEKPGQRWTFTGLIILLMANVLVILASSLQRLMLYETAYGFSELRTVTHVFIFWLAALVAAAAVMEGVQQRGRFALALLIAVVGFSASLVLLNVDGFTARKNIERAVQGEEFDAAYLTTLSSDAVPALVTAYKDPSLSSQIHDALGLTLACRTVDQQDATPQPWQSYHFGLAQEAKLLQENADLLSQVKLFRDDRGFYYGMWNGEKLYCGRAGFMD
ncbi:MAG: DUF4173 domain-containing protein [Anaerolineaceae bacterium]|jgi:hypothetical protein